jgi:hypothetical protein
MSRKVLSYEIVGTMLTVSDGDEIVAEFDRTELPQPMLSKMLDLGHSTKVVNFAAGIKGTDDKVAAMQDGWARLVAGEWEKAREGGGPTVSPEVEALAEIKGASVAAIQKALREFDEEKRKAILANPKVVAIAKRIRAEREDAEVDLTDL